MTTAPPSALPEARPPWRPFFGALAITLATIALCWLLRPLLGPGIFAVALAGTTLCALLFGSGPATLATALIALELWDLFTPGPLHVSLPTPPQTLRLLAYLVSAALILAIARARQAALERLAQTNARLEAANAGLQQAVASRDRLLAVVSHDLKSPLNAILLSTDLLASGGDDPRLVTRIAGTIKTSAQRMDALVRDLLDLALLEAGTFALHRQVRPITGILEQTLAVMRPQADSKGVRLRTDVAAALPPIDVDSNRIRQALSNLIGNAIRFTPAGGTVTVEVRSSPPAAVRISVRDTGSGIADEALPHLFDRTWMAQHYVSQQGTGLGLSIAKAAVEAHGGRIWATNNADTGATFSFTVPTAAPTADVAA